MFGRGQHVVSKSCGNGEQCQMNYKRVLPQVRAHINTITVELLKRVSAGQILPRRG